MRISKIVLPLAVCIFTISVFISQVDSATANREADCYQLLLDKVGSVSGGDRFLTAAPTFTELNVASLTSVDSAFDSTLAGLTFKQPIFKLKSYDFGEASQFKKSTHYLEILHKAVGEELDNGFMHEFEIEFQYSKKDNELLACRANIRSTNDGLAFTNLKEDLIVANAPWKILSNIENIDKNGAKYKRMAFEVDSMNADYSKAIYGKRIVYVAPESTRIDFNPYELIDAFVKATNDFYSKVIPKLEQKIAGKNLEKIILLDTPNLKMECATSREWEDTAYSIPPTWFNNKLLNIYNYYPWVRYQIMRELVYRGQSDVVDVWITHLANPARETMIAVESGTMDIEDAEIGSDFTISDLKYQISKFLGAAISIAREEDTSVEDAVEADDVKLFWRIKQLFEGGANDADAKDFVSDYPEHLETVAKAEQKLLEIANSRASDIEKEAWYASFVYELMDWGVIKGYPDGTYRPGNLINRAEMAKIAVILFSIPLPDSVTSNPFPDVPKDAWFAPYVAAAKEAGVIDGYPDGKFQPSGSVNRAEAMKILTIASGVSLSNVISANFPDVNNREWYSPYVNFSGKKGVVSGYADGKFKPGNNINRAEIAKMAAKAKKLLIK
ncbi:MAG: S-layer homology domain-containing protein [Candidatus Gracilibacteria bacterium]|jgi:hypothetical protein